MLITFSYYKFDSHITVTYSISKYQIFLVLLFYRAHGRADLYLKGTAGPWDLVDLLFI